MYYTGKWIEKNIYLLDSHDMQVDLVQGDHCFLIGYHVKLPSTVNQTSVDEAFGHPLFEGKSFIELWEEISR